MNEGTGIAVLSEILVAILLVGGAAITLIGSMGLLLRLKSFYERAHAPTLGTTLGTACVALASAIYFSTVESRFVLHEILIVIFVTVTTPISLMLLVRATVLRDAFENDATIASRVESEKR